MTEKKLKTDDAKFSGYGSIEVANGRFRNRLNKANWPDTTKKLRVMIDADITYPINSADDVGQEYVLEVRKVVFK